MILIFLCRETWNWRISCASDSTERGRNQLHLLSWNSKKMEESAEVRQLCWCSASVTNQTEIVDQLAAVANNLKTTQPSTMDFGVYRRAVDMKPPQESVYCQGLARGEGTGTDIGGARGNVTRPNKHILTHKAR